MSEAMKNQVSRREWLLRAAKTAAAVPVIGMLSSCGGGAGGSGTITPPPTTAGSYTGTDDQLMDEIERAAFDFFWTEASPSTDSFATVLPLQAGEPAPLPVSPLPGSDSLPCVSETSAPMVMRRRSSLGCSPPSTFSPTPCPTCTASTTTSWVSIPELVSATPSNFLILIP